MALLLNEYNTIATVNIMPGVVDNFFKGGPIMAYLKSRFNRRWAGHTIQENYLFRAQSGGVYKKGTPFNTDRRQTKTGMLFGPRYYAANVTQFREDLSIEMAGPTAVFSQLKTDLAEAALTLSTILEIDIVKHGQDLSGAGGEDRTANINGLEEAFTNGTDTTYSGATFSAYGGQTRSDVGTALNSPTGLIPASFTTMSYRTLIHSHLSTQVGGERARAGFTTKRVQGFMAETFAPQQIIDTTDPEINWPGLKFNGATIIASDYLPGADGVVDADLGSYYSAGETFMWFNPGPQGDDAYIRLYLSADPLFAFGFTGFKPARNDNQLSGQILFAGNLTCRSPRTSRFHYGITR